MTKKSKKQSNKTENLARQIYCSFLGITGFIDTKVSQSSLSSKE